MSLLTPSDVGKVVHYVLDRGTNSGECRAAIVIRVWPELQGIQRLNLQVFIDGGNDDPTARSPYVVYKTSVDRSLGSAHKGKWHSMDTCRSKAQVEKEPAAQPA